MLTRQTLAVDPESYIQERGKQQSAQPDRSSRDGASDRILNQRVKVYVDELKEKWNELSLEEKRQGMNHYVKMIYMLRQRLQKVKRMLFL